MSLKDKIREGTEEKADPPPRARKENVAQSLVKIVKKAAQIADLMTGDDVEQDLKVLRQAKRATHKIYDTEKKKLVNTPDHKTRLAATTLSRAYHEGKPIERSIVAHGDFEDLGTMLGRLTESPEVARMLPRIAELPALEAEVVQETPGPDSLQNTAKSNELSETEPDLPVKPEEKSDAI